MSKEKLYCTWDDLTKLVSKIEVQCGWDDYKPDLVVGIARGGLVPAVMLSHRFEVPHIPVVWTTRDFIGHADFSHQNLSHISEVRHAAFAKKDVLIVDDICDSGKTFETLQKHLPDGNGHVLYASLHCRSSSSFSPHYKGEMIYDDKWIVYPYEKR